MNGLSPEEIPVRPADASRAAMAAQRPVVAVVWEITLRCNLKCVHCGSRAGDKRQRELTTQEALGVVQELAAVGVTEVALIGGEAYLRDDWEEIARAIVRAGMDCGMTTGGWGLGASLARRIAAAGITTVSVSIDGLEATHDNLRGRPGSHRACMAAIRHLQAVGLRPNVNTQINRYSLPELPSIYKQIHAAGIAGWQVQFTGPMGRAADRPDLVIQPAELPLAHDVLARVAARAWADGIVVSPGFNVGYFGPHERSIRGNGAPFAFWQGPDQGLRTLGIESDGTVKPDATLPTARYSAGSLLEKPLSALLQSPIMSFVENLTHDQLSGFCATCRFGEVCLGGDPWMAVLLGGEVGNNPFCDFRARSLAACGRREYVERVAEAPGQPYDTGRYVCVEESATVPWPAQRLPLLRIGDIHWPADWTDPAGQPGIRRAFGRDVEPVPSAGTLLPRVRAGSAARRVGKVVAIKRYLDTCNSQSEA